MTMHEQDDKLVRLAAEYATGSRRSKISTDRRQHLADAIKLYTGACEISRGPDASRSAAWSVRAAECWTELTEQLWAAKEAVIVNDQRKDKT